MGKPMPQITRTTGVSGDYVNTSVPSYMRCYRGLGKLLACLKKYPLRKYLEEYPETKYDDVVNDKNRQSIKRLDCLVDIINNRVKNDSLTMKDFARVMRLVGILIYGKEEGEERCGIDLERVKE